MSEAVDNAVGTILREVGALASRYRSAPQSWLIRSRLRDVARVEAGRSLAQHLAVVAQGIEERERAASPRWRTVPDHGPFAVGDQIAVTGGDVVQAASGLPPGTPVWTPAGRRSAGEVLVEAADACRALRARV